LTQGVDVAGGGDHVRCSFAVGRLALLLDSEGSVTSNYNAPEANPIIF
jgi:hypothetical protein